MAALVASPLLLFPTVRPTWTALALLALVGVWIARWAVRREAWPATPVNGALLVFAVMIPVGIWASAFPELTLDKATGLVLGLAAFRVVALTVRDRRALLWASALFCAVGLGFVGIGVVSAAWLDKVSALSAITHRIPRLIGSLPGLRIAGVAPNQIAGVLTLLLPSALALAGATWLAPARSAKGWAMRIASAFGVLFVGAILLLTQSRSGWMGAAAGTLGLFALWGTLEPRRWVRRLCWSCVLLGVLGGAGVVLWVGPERVAQLVLGSEDSAAALESVVGTVGGTWAFRLNVWQAAVYGVQDFLFTGCGLGTFREVARLLYPLPSVSPSYDIAHAHNIFLQTGLDLGVAGLTAYLALLALSALTAWRVARRDAALRPWALGLLAALVGHHVYGMTDALSLGAKPGLALWLLLGLVAAMEPLARSSAEVVEEDGDLERERPDVPPDPVEPQPSPSPEQHKSGEEAMDQTAAPDIAPPATTGARIRAVVAGIVTACVAALAGWQVYRQLLVGRGPFHWDEAAHGLKGVLFAHSIRHGHWLALLFDGYRQVLYPPVHALEIAVFYLLFGTSIQVASAVSLVSYVLLAPTLYAAAHLLRRDHAWVAGAVAAILVLGSPGLISFATQTMLEVPALLLFSLTMLLYLKLLRDTASRQDGASLQDGASPRAYALLGLAVGITYLARIQYGVMIFLAIALTMALNAWLDRRPLFRRQTWTFLGALVLVFGVWFAYPAKLVSTLGWLVNEPNVSDPYSLSGWLFYPRAAVRLAGSPVMFVALAALVVLAAVRFARDRRARFLLVTLTAQMALAIVHQNRQDRYLFPILPAAYLLAGHATAELWSRARAHKSVLWRGLSAGVTLLLVVQSGALFVTALQQPPIASNRHLQTATEVADVIRTTGTSFIISSVELNEPSAPLMDWALVQAGLLEPPHAGSLAQIEEGRRLAGLISRLPLPAWLAGPLQSAVTGWDAPGTTRTVYVGLPERAGYSQSSQAFDGFFKATYGDGSGFESVVVIELLRGGRRYALDTYVLPTLEKAGLARTDTVTTTDGTLQVDVYRLP